MKQEFKPMTWNVKCFDCNAQKIIDHNVLKYRENQIKQLKKQYTSKAGFGEALRHELMYSYWAKAEWELIIELTENHHILLKPWCGCRDEEQATIDVTDDITFDWKGFAAEHIGKQTYKNKAKVDVYSQLTYGDNWERLIDYCWNYHHKWQRNKR